MGHAFENDVDLQLPQRPRLIPELIQVPIGDDGVLFVGGENYQVLRGRSARRVVAVIGPLLDGNRTLDEIVVAAKWSRTDVRDVVSLLCSRGLLEDGAIKVPGASAEVASYLGRYADVSRANANRGVALSRLAQCVVGVRGPASWTRFAAEALLLAGVGEVRSNGEGDVDLVLSSGGERHVARNGVATLMVRLGVDETHIGPLLRSSVTCCPTCLDRIHPHPQGEPSRNWARYWIGLAATSLVNVVAQVVVTSQPNVWHHYHRGGDGILRHGVRLAAPLPGCLNCGVGGTAADPTDSLLVPWIYHCATALPGAEFVAPRDHQGHYAVGNIELAQEVRPPLLGEVVVALPAAAALDVGVPWSSIEFAAARAPDLLDLATLLSRSVGLFRDQGVLRRVAPTGGNLGSVDLFVIARDVPSLDAAVYHYDAPNHRLDRLADIPSNDALADAIGSDQLPPCLIVGAGQLSRCAQKYGAFTYRLVHLDSGVALAYLHAIAAARGILACERPDIDVEALARSVGLTPAWEFPLPTFALALGTPKDCAAMPKRSLRKSPVPDALRSQDYGDTVLSRLLELSCGPPPAPYVSPDEPRPSHLVSSRISSLDKVLNMRRAIRHWDERPLDVADLGDLLGQVKRAITSRPGSPPCFVRPLLALARAANGLEPGLYDGLRQVGGFDSLAMRSCINQDGLGASPAAIFFLADLDAAVRARGVRGYREAVQHAGVGAGHAWLVATSLGLAGTAAGGVLAAGIREATGIATMNGCALLAFHFGWPKRSQEIEVSA